MTPTQRSLALARDRGYLAAVVERWNPHARIRQDLFGIIDILAVGEGKTLAIQTTSRGNMAARVRKIEDCEALPELIRSGWKIEVHGWAKNSKGRWEVKVLEIN